MLPMLGEVVYPGKHTKLVNSLCSYILWIWFNTVSIVLELVVFVYCFFSLFSHTRVETRIYGAVNIVILSNALTSVSRQLC
jgi:hypothetical protein